MRDRVSVRSRKRKLNELSSTELGANCPHPQRPIGISLPNASNQRLGLRLNLLLVLFPLFSESNNSNHTK